ncbi:MAG: M23 family metallopeptidase [Gaiellaceae bacterium]
MRRGVPLLGIVLLVAALAAAAARAADSSGTTTTSTTTATTTTTSTTSTQTYAPLYGAPLPRDCVGAGAAALRRPGRAIMTLGTPAATSGPSDYPTKTPAFAFDSASVSGSRCRSNGVTLHDVSLFGGTVTATSIQATNGRGTVTGLAIDGSPVAASTGDSIAVEDWGLLKIGAASGRLSAPLALRLLTAHGSQPAGTTLFLAFGAVRRHVVAPKQAPAETTPAQTGVHPTAKRLRAHSKNAVRQPLKWTPRLGISSKHYVFPVDTGASYIDTYGANRNDIYDGWHHGDDLFDPLGTPVVAVATGKLSLVGWNSLGGWRIWLTDAKGNSFYYAHLSGYARWILHDRHVRAGQVIGFLGRTGDASTTTPHLHFEVHPHQLLKLGYDGAVDPTTYLKAWRVENLPANAIPQAARLRAPKGTPTQEAAVVWSQLLAARHLMPNGLPAVAFTASLHRPFPGVQEQVDRTRRLAAVRLAEQAEPPSTEDGPWPLVVLGLTLAASLIGAVLSARRRQARPLQAPLH